MMPGTCTETANPAQCRERDQCRLNLNRKMPGEEGERMEVYNISGQEGLKAGLRRTGEQEKRGRGELVVEMERGWACLNWDSEAGEEN